MEKIGCPDQGNDKGGLTLSDIGVRKPFDFSTCPLMSAFGYKQMGWMAPAPGI